jgi:hypothetical protein
MSSPIRAAARQVPGRSRTGLTDPGDGSPLRFTPHDFRRHLFITDAGADAGSLNAALGLTDLLYERGDLDRAEQILRARADAGYEAAGVVDLAG